MRILLVADGRSPITQRWHASLLRQGHRISLVSTFPCPPLPDIEYFTVIPVAFSRLAAQKTAAAAPSSAPKARGRLRPVVERFRGAFLMGRYLLGPLSVEAAAGAFRKAVACASPDLVHALRIPYEGMLASHTPAGIPLVVSIWGNDLTLHARGSAWMGALTRKCLGRAAGLMADAGRDVRLARQWGLPTSSPTLVVPGSGGIDLAEIRSRTSRVDDLLGEGVDGCPPVLINPRGFRTGSVRNDTFFQALPELFKRRPDLRVVCPAMAGQPEALQWVRRLGLDSRLRLLPQLPQPRLWDLFHRAQVFVSPSQHDGTPNSLLEAMASGCFPVAGDIESIREWITPGVNGLLVQPADPAGLAEALDLALSNPDLRRSAAGINARIIAARAEVQAVSEKVQDFYNLFLKVREPEVNR